METFARQSKMPNAAVVDIIVGQARERRCFSTKVVKFYFGHKWPNRLQLPIALGTISS
jgi:hypothetical protein